MIPHGTANNSSAEGSLKMSDLTFVCVCVLGGGLQPKKESHCDCPHSLKLGLILCFSTSAPYLKVMKMRF